MALDGADELGRAAGGLDILGRVDGVQLRLVVVLLPIQVVQQAHETPELNVVGVVLAREVAHGLLHRLGVLDMERVLVVLLQQRERLVARHAGFKRGHGMLLSFCGLVIL